MLELPVPRQLPRDVTHFVNREEQMRLLDELLGSVSLDAYAEPVFAAIAGAPGVGKTALAVHWAHRIRDKFVDGDLYLDFRGHGLQPRIQLDDGLDAFLRALKIQPEQIPPGTEARSALLRSTLVGKQVLLVLDNVATAADTRPFLPGSSGCMVVATSRSALAGLVVRDGARRMTLGALTMDESLALLGRIVGDSRIEREPGAARRLVELCGFLPLTLRIIAERIVSQPDRGLRDFTQELDAERARLDRFSSTDDDEVDVRAVFSSSYRGLSPEVARTFRLASLHPGTSFSKQAASAILQEEVATAERQLESLAGFHLVQRQEHGRYKFHDLLREYAAERVRSDELPASQIEARRRVLAWYVHSVDVACHVVLPNFHKLNLDELELASDPPEFSSSAAAWTWFEKELTNLTQAIHDALASGDFDIAWRLPAVMYPLLELHQHWRRWLETQELGIAAARSAGNAYGEACNLLGLGDAQWLMQQRDDAVGSYRRALLLARQVGSGWVEGFSLRQIGVVLLELGRTREALQLLREARIVFARIQERRGEGMALLSMAVADRALGSFDSALGNAQRGLEVLSSISDLWSTAWAKCAVGQALLDAQRPREALAQYEEALHIFRTTDDRRNQGRAFLGIAIALKRLGRDGESQEALSEVRKILSNLNDDALNAEMLEMMEQLTSL